MEEGDTVEGLQFSGEGSCLGTEKLAGNKKKERKKKKFSSLEC